MSTINIRKCEINGDELCDTEADPGIRKPGKLTYLFPNSCDYNPSIGGVDNWGNVWTPTVSNIMSYAPSYCRTSFSPLQVAKMYGYISGIDINNSTLNIIGPKTVCHNQIVTYSISPVIGATNYTYLEV